ncbi:hypothetical protein [Marinimicrobium sp. C2-29]|uniref:hypothetical protein n=1 Tax=Marinimicrobium sp. C2-29 TaxID=3139825 RepID=UPI003139481D
MLRNPAAEGGIDFGGALDRLVDGYAKVQQVKNERDAMRYQNAPNEQEAALHESEAATTSEAYQTGNARVPGTGKPSMGGYVDQIPKPLLYGSLGLLGLGLLMKAVK